MPFHILKEGDKNEYVFLLREALQKQNLLTINQTEPESADVFDDDTQKAVMSFQREQGLTVDGLVGKNTWYMIFAPLKSRMVNFFNKSIYYNNHYKGINIFNNQPALLFLYKVDLLNFLRIFSDVKLLTGREQINLNEFVAHFSIMYNETGGLNVFTEIGGPAYMFGTNGGRKYSYNSAIMGNIPAGNTLKQKGVISSDADVALWNGNVYPSNAPTEVKKAAEDCDFYKFRGRGLHQLTFRDNYVKYAKPVLDKFNLDLLTMSNAELDTAFQRPEINVEVFKNFISLQPGAEGILEKVRKNADFDAYALMVAGNTPLMRKYAEKVVTPRCKVLKDAIMLNLQPTNIDNISLND